MEPSEREPTDEMIAKRVQSGMRELFAILVGRYEKKLLRYGKKFLSTREDIEDLVQDVFIRAYQNLQSFDTNQKFSPWIYRIAHNTFINGIKKKIRSPLTLFDFDTLLSYEAYDDPAPSEREQEEMKKMLDKGLSQISPKYREVLILYYLEEIPYKEISEILQVPPGTVGIRLKRAKVALREAYEKMNMHYGDK